MIFESVYRSSVAHQRFEFRSCTVLRNLPYSHRTILPTRSNVFPIVTVCNSVNSTRMSSDLEHLIPPFDIPYNDVSIFSARCEILIVFAVGEHVNEIFMALQRTNRLSSFSVVYRDDTTIHSRSNERSFGTADHRTN